MLLPNLDNAFIDLSKLKEYCLNDEHPVGKYKARVFRSALQFKKIDAQKLYSAIINGIKHHEAKESKQDFYGKGYIVDIPISNLELNAVVRTVWFISKDKTFPKLITCYIKAKK